MTADGGVTDYATGFVELGNLVVDPWGTLVVTDRRGHRVWRCFNDGTKTNIAGTGATFGGGAGQLATETGLNEVRGVWFLPTGAYFLCTHRGSQVWFVDLEGYIHLFLNGSTSDTHAGDDMWFWDPGGFRVSENRAVTMDFEGNLLITENDHVDAVRDAMAVGDDERRAVIRLRLQKRLQGVLVFRAHRPHRGIFQQRDLRQLMGCPEAVEEMQERNLWSLASAFFTIGSHSGRLWPGQASRHRSEEVATHRRGGLPVPWSRPTVFWQPPGKQQPLTSDLRRGQPARRPPIRVGQ